MVILILRNDTREAFELVKAEGHSMPMSESQDEKQLLKPQGQNHVERSL